MNKCSSPYVNSNPQAENPRFMSYLRQLRHSGLHIMNGEKKSQSLAGHIDILLLTSF